MADYVTPAEQAMNLIRYIGDEVKREGCPIDIAFTKTPDIMKAQTQELAEGLIVEIQNMGLIKIGQRYVVGNGEIVLMNVNLSLNGWEQYEEEQRGKFAGNYGFLAMEFDNPELDTFVQEVLKPAIKEGINYDLKHLRDKSTAGVIDNIMRVAIRDARFIIADLTHDNHGAYWEGGYAEGLGKPVIYICEKEKFERSREEGGGTHFDTNHCTTIAWTRDDDEGFREELIATLRRTLEVD